MSDYLNKRRQWILDGKPVEPKKPKPIPKKSAKKIEQEKKDKEARGGDDTELVKWFNTKIKYSSGFCTECGCKVEREVFQYAVMTVCHLLDKRDTKCPSVKTHPANFIILCPDHHHKFDNINWDEREKWGCWPIVRDRLIMVYPDLDPSERRHFPDSVLKYMESKEPF